MKYWTIAEAAKMVDLSPITIRWHIRMGNIEAKKFGRDWMITTAIMNKLMERSRKKPLKEAK